jgi:hypothetical protein
MCMNGLEIITLRVLVESNDLDHGIPAHKVNGYVKVTRLVPTFLMVQFGRGATQDTAINDSIRIFEYTTNSKVVSYDIVSDDKFLQLGN